MAQNTRWYKLFPDPRILFRLLAHFQFQSGTLLESATQDPLELSESGQFSKINTTAERLALILQCPTADVNEWLEMQSRSREANDKALYDLNEEFNSSLDSGNKIQIGSTSFSRSFLLFMTDRIAYKNELSNWLADQDEQKIKAVRDDVLPLGENDYRLTLLIEKIRRQRVTPFIGAGLSMAAGLPGWSNFLRKCASAHEIDGAKVEELILEGNFEGCADLILNASHPDLLKEKFQIFFKETDYSTYSHELLPELQTGD